MLESQWLAKSDEEVEWALKELGTYTPDAQHVILAEARRRELDQQNQDPPPVAPGTGLGELFSARGRLSRLSYFGRITGCYLVTVVFVRGAGSALGEASLPLVVVMLLLCTWVSIASGVKRCHDMDQSGHWMWLYGLIPFAGLILVFSKGTEGTNRFDLGPSAGENRHKHYPAWGSTTYKPKSDNEPVPSHGSNAFATAPPVPLAKLDHLAQTAFSDPDEAVRKGAQAAIQDTFTGGKAGFEKIMNDMVEALGDPERVEIALITLLGFGEMSIPYVEPLLANPDPAMRRMAVRLIAELKQTP